MKKLLIVFILLLGSIVYGREVSFSWEPMEGAIQYEIELSPTKDFSKPFLTQKLKTPDFSATLNPGKYYYRVRVIDSTNHPGKWTEMALVTVSSPTPELAAPSTGTEISYFEHVPEVAFSWKEVDLTAVYEIVVRDHAGTDVIHTTIDKTKYVTNLAKGEYQWQVRCLGKSPIPGQAASEDVPSEFSKPWTLKVTKNEMTKPVLKTPLDGAKLLTHAPIEFSWIQDSHAHFADVYVERTDGDKTSTKKFDNIKETSLSKLIDEPGTYRWYVIAKEETGTPGVQSDSREFKLMVDPLFAGNYELELSGSYVSDVYLTNSSLQTMKPVQLGQQSTSGGMFYGLSAGYYVFRSLGFYLSLREAPLTVENIFGYQREFDGTMRLRYGANGFFQEFWFGYRQMDIIETENTFVSHAVDILTNGPFLGTRISAEVNPRIRIQATGYYYKPINNNLGQSYGPFNADVAGGSLGVKWNFKDRFWVGYRFAIEKVIGQLTGPLSPPYINSSWTLNRTEPLFFSISYEK